MAEPTAAQQVPYLIALRNADASFALYGNGAVRRISGAIEYQRLANELGVRVLEISGEEHDTLATISKALFGM
jgi:hypothetical protein